VYWKSFVKGSECVLWCSNYRRKERKGRVRKGKEGRVKKGKEGKVQDGIGKNKMG
jgi:hypothetical protein